MRTAIVIAAVLASSGSWLRATAQSSALDSVRTESDLTAGADERVDLEPAPENRPDSQQEAVSFSLSAIELRNAPNLPADAIAALTGQYVGREIGFADLVRLADELEGLYKAQGYFLARVVVPAQRVENGVLYLDALEGALERKRVVTESEVARRQIDASLETLELGQPLTRDRAERRILLAASVPGVSLRPVLSSGTAPGTIALTAEASRDPFAASLSWRNLNAPEVGRGGILGQVSVSGKSLYGDRLSLAGFVSDDLKEQAVASARYTRRVASNGLAVDLNVSHSTAEPGGPISALDFASDATTVGVGLSYPFVLRQRSSLTGRVGFSGADVDSDVFGSVGLFSDRVRQVELSLEGRHRLKQPVAGARWSAQGSLGAYQGVSALGASKPADVLLSRPFADPQAVSVRGETRLSADWNGNWGADLRAVGQWSDEPLLSFNEYSAGNYTIGRGYDAGALSSDRLLGASVSVSGPNLLTAVGAARNAKLSIRPTAFYDIVEGQTIDPGFEDERTISSRGIGFRMDVASGLSLSAEWVDPVQSPQRFGPEAPSRVLVSVSLNSDGVRSWFRRS